MNLNFAYPDLIPDPSFSFTTPNTRQPVFPARPPKAATAQQDNEQGRAAAAAAATALYDEQLRRALGGGEEDLPEQEERVYRAEGNIRNFGYNFLLPPGRRQTQAETEHAGSRSPTPSDGRPHDHRQEDNQLPSAGDLSDAATLGAGAGAGAGAGDASPLSSVDGDGEDGERDLDEEMEDRDLSSVSEEGSG
ncbi:hypothetical protein QFC21_006888 [Naganishia friedmannii]|uniref:Uncharacterized protein n=1 Tax=Naganishia friedmannii TaxID=89922 RepID=A0ACC2V0L9_9TREE|nr:hypothetical protein QFC21_006888 [Naganishia friedmannii]